LADGDALLRTNRGAHRFALLGFGFLPSRGSLVNQFPRLLLFTLSLEERRLGRRPSFRFRRPFVLLKATLGEQRLPCGFLLLGSSLGGSGFFKHTDPARPGLLSRLSPSGTLVTILG
jgi:hypothetical protein